MAFLLCTMPFSKKLATMIKHLYNIYVKKYSTFMLRTYITSKDSYMKRLFFFAFFCIALFSACQKSSVKPVLYPYTIKLSSIDEGANHYGLNYSKNLVSSIVKVSPSATYTTIDSIVFQYDSHNNQLLQSAAKCLHK